MKHLRKLSKSQKVFLENQGLSSKEFLLERKNAESYTFYHVPTKALVTIRR